MVFLALRLMVIERFVRRVGPGWLYVKATNKSSLRFWIRLDEAQTNNRQWY